jgi:hypothetical protein
MRVERNVFAHGGTKITGEGPTNEFFIANNLNNEVSNSGGYYFMNSAFWLHNTYFNGGQFRDFEKNPVFQHMEPYGYRAAFMKNSIIRPSNIWTPIQHATGRVRRPGVDLAFDHNLYVTGIGTTIDVSTRGHTHIALGVDLDRNIYSGSGSFAQTVMGNSTYNPDSAGGLCIDSLLFKSEYEGPDSNGDCPDPTTGLASWVKKDVFATYYLDGLSDLASYDSNTSTADENASNLMGQYYLTDESHKVFGSNGEELTDDNGVVLDSSGGAGYRLDNKYPQYSVEFEPGVERRAYNSQGNLSSTNEGTSNINHNLFTNRIEFIKEYCYNAPPSGSQTPKLDLRKSPKVDWTKTYRCWAGDPNSHFVYEYAPNDMIAAVNSWVGDIRFPMGDFTTDTIKKYIKLFDPFSNASDIPNSGGTMDVSKCDKTETQQLAHFYTGVDTQLNTGRDNLTPASHVGPAKYFVLTDFHGNYRRVRTPAGAFGFGNGQDQTSGCRTNDEYDSN